ncbi:MAG: PilZ domain-containing protein [Magnetococcales bacterium]|nr:PilZ domain-containing protein [Magnetococcales bacterium]
MMELERMQQQQRCKRISRRIPAEGHGVLVLGEARHQVGMREIGLHGMSVISPVTLACGEQVVMEISEDHGVDAYRCRVVFCQEGAWGWQTGLEIVEQDDTLLVIHLP